MTVTTYKIQVEAPLKKVVVAVGAHMTIAEAERFATEFQRTVTSIDASTYTLEVDCTSMKVLNTELTERLTGAMGLYKEAGFKKTEFIVNNDTILKMQLSRVARNAGLTNAEVIMR